MTKICIYCDQKDQEKFKGVEHVIPQSFGKFGTKTPTLDCVCDDCNAYFAKELDQTLARETLEGITRYRKGKYSSEKRPQKKLRITLDEGSETGDFAGALIQGVDSKTGKLLGPLSQFLLLNIKSGKYDAFPKEEIKDLKISDELYGKQGQRKARALAPSKDEYDAVVEELHKAGIPYKQSGELFQPPFLQDALKGIDVKLPVVVEGKIDEIRKRALVKCLVNFVAYYIGKNEIMKPEWDSIKKSVRLGMGFIKLSLTSDPFWTGQESKDRRFANDSINIRIENKKVGLVGVMQFYNLFTYEFVLVEKYQLPPQNEIAYRFTPNEEPIPGVKMKKPAV